MIRHFMGSVALAVSALLGMHSDSGGEPVAAGNPRSPVSAETLDYLIQDVCVGADDAPVPGDPASCPRHRDLRVGERLPYIVSDFDRSRNASLGFQSSIPVVGSGGDLMVMVTKDLSGGYTPNFQFAFSPKRNAFDLIDLGHSPYASIVRTFDGGCFDQILARNAGARNMADRAGGWVLFPLRPPPTQWSDRGSMLLTTFRKQLDPAGPQCASNSGAGLTQWARPVVHTFESGKRLRAIRSDHFAQADLSQPVNSFERYYLTREYGTSRWESWWTVAYCRQTLGKGSPQCGQSAANPLRSRCSVLNLQANQTAGIEVWGGQRWVRMDCRDSTRYLPLRTAFLPLSPDMARRNGRLDIDFARTVQGNRRP